jgi:hypothetical protein
MAIMPSIDVRLRRCQMCTGCQIMTSDAKSMKTPEEIELEEKLVELGGLEDELAQKELDLVTLVAELREFENLYMRVVGIKFAELDRIEAEILELIFQFNPDDIESGREARKARERAEESEKSASAAQERSDKDRFHSSQELRKLFREAARKMHPDLADNDEERKRRNRIMAEINHAYQEGDADKLQQILMEWESSPEVVKGEDAGSRLIRAIRKIAQVRTRLDALQKELEEVFASSICELSEKAKNASAEGKDLLKDMADQLDRAIQDANLRLSQIKT